MLRREDDDIFTSLEKFRNLYRDLGYNSPFSAPHASIPEPILEETSAAATTSTTTRTTTTTKTSTTTTITTSTTTTVATTTAPGPYDLWYYKDFTEFIHGPFSSETMRQWDNAGYFRLNIILMLSLVLKDTSSDLICC